MTFLGKFALTDLLALFIVGILWAFVAESRRRFRGDVKERLESIISRTFFGLIGFAIVLILLAIWGVR